MSRNQKNDMVSVKFHSLIAGALTAGSFGVGLSPNSSISPTRLPVMADAYAHFRWKNFRMRMHPTVRSANQAFGFVGGVQDASPSTIAQVGELLSSQAFATGQTTPSKWVVPTTDELRGPLPWYKSVAGGADSTEEQPGLIVVAGTTTDTFLLEFVGEIQFKVAVATGNTPEQLLLQRRLHSIRVEQARELDRTQILRVLAPVAGPGVGGE